MKKRLSGFSLIELLVVIAILGMMATAILIAINPGKRNRQARDAQRKHDISTLTNALIGYYTIVGVYPEETTWCDTSIGSGYNGSQCPPGNDPPYGDEWDYTIGGLINFDLVYKQGLLKKLPVDPVNNTTYYYSYKPRVNLGLDHCINFGGSDCLQYWIGTRLEAPKDPAKPIYRCSDYDTLTDGPGCKEVGPNSLLETLNPTN